MAVVLRPRPPAGVSRIAGLLLLAASLMIGAGCTSQPAHTVVDPHTLAASTGLPLADLERQFGPAQWQKLSQLKYEAYVLIEASIRTDESLRLGKVQLSDGDPSWHELAEAFAAEAKLHVSSVGTHLDPPAEVLVVFFKPAEDGNLALIFARQKNEPEPGMLHRALYVQTRRYQR